MTQVDFYIIDIPGSEASQQFACRLAEKAWQKGHRVHIHTGDAALARRLDEMMWTFRDLSFVPHCLGTAAQAADTPIHIGYDEEGIQHDDVLINLAPEVPLFFSHFHRVAELVAPDEDARQRGRQRFSFYRDRGYPLQSHTISAGSTT